jgi:hypothetical protein
MALLPSMAAPCLFHQTLPPRPTRPSLSRSWLIDCPLNAHTSRAARLAAGTAVDVTLRVLFHGCEQVTGTEDGARWPCMHHNDELDAATGSPGVSGSCPPSGSEGRAMSTAGSGCVVHHPETSSKRQAAPQLNRRRVGQGRFAATASAGAAIIRPPGHHAEGGLSMGFCVFNNVAVAARAAQAAAASMAWTANAVIPDVPHNDSFSGPSNASIFPGPEHGGGLGRPPMHNATGGKRRAWATSAHPPTGAAAAPLRVLILDWDVHHGNGTQHAFEDDDSVMFISLHRHDGGAFYPGA